MKKFLLPFQNMVSAFAQGYGGQASRFVFKLISYVRMQSLIQS